MQVGITTDSVRGALVVPVTALLAQSTGGYSVEVVGAGASNHLVPVMVGLAERPHARPTQLSGGQRQRVAIARALVGLRAARLSPTQALWSV